MLRRCLVVAACAIAVGSAPVAHAGDPESDDAPSAEDPAAADDDALPDDAPNSNLITAPAIAAFQKRDFAAALSLFDEAYRRAPLPRIALWRARALARNGRLLDAERAYADIEALKPAEVQQAYARAKADGLAVAPMDEQTKAIESAEPERLEVAERIPTLVVGIEGAEGATVSVNGQPFAASAAPVRYDPGAFRIEGRLPDGRVEVRTIHLAERDAATVRLPMQPPVARDDPGATQTTVGWICLGVGVAGVVVGGILTGVAVAKLADADCPDDTCPPDKFDVADEYNDIRFAAGFSMIVGGMIGALGLGLILSAPDDPVEAAALIGPGYVGLRGSF